MAGPHSEEEARQEAGGPSSPAASATGSGTDVGARIIALDALTNADLRTEWRRLYRATPPTRLSRDLLIRGIAYKIQERVYGGLSQGATRRLRSLIERPDKHNRSRAAPAITLKPATKLVREWRGNVHTVTVLDEGFDYRGQRYRSLTQIAQLVTGTHWSGPLFFGLSKRRRAVEATGE
ncbi:MAG TPA: DUF2924 domain-containing protein [Stellaceae bacterium]|nr:DUF2924 domain-containing protein [Stellaceae bacterium]